MIILILLLLQAGNYVHNDIVSIVIQLIASATQLHSYSVRQLYFAVMEDFSQQPLTQVNQLLSVDVP